MTFAEPVWLWMLPAVVLFLAGVWLYGHRRRRALLPRFAASHLVQDLARSHSSLRRGIKNGLVLLGVVAACVALARPQWGYQWQETRAKGIDVVIGLDASRSMLAEDILPNRLERAKLAILDFQEQMRGNRLGLVAFAGQAFLQCPLTLDENAFRLSLEDIDTQTIQLGGTDIATAVREAQAAFSKEQNHKVLVLLTDGEDLEASGIEAAQEAADAGLTIYTVGVGTPEGAYIPVPREGGGRTRLLDPDGKPVLSKLDEATLARIAEATGGFYVPLGALGQGLREVYENGIETIPAQELESQMQQRALERYAWPLGLALALLALEPLIGTRRRFGLRAAGLPLAAVLATLLFMPESRAQDLQQRDPTFNMPKETKVPEVSNDLPAKEQARQHFNNGVTLYRQHNYQGAEEAFGKALEKSPDLSLQQKSFYNLGNTAYQRWLKERGESPEQVLSKLPYIPGLSAQPPTQQAVQQSLDAIEEALERYRKALPQVEEAERAFQSAAELNPENADAHHNRNLARQKKQAFAQSIEDFGTLQEELKKLLEEMEQQQQESPQQQPPQEEQEQQQQNQEQGSQEEQSSESSQENQQSSQQQGQQSGQQQDSSQSEQSGESSQQEGTDEASTEKASDEDASESGQSGEGETQEPSNGSDEADPDAMSQEALQERLRRMIEEERKRQAEVGVPDPQADPAEEEPETPTAGGEPAEAGEPGEEAEPEAAVTESQGQPGEDGQSVAALQEGEPGEATGETVTLPGAMTVEQARRLLDSLKDQERNLPLAGYGESRREEDKKRRDW